MPKTSFFDEKQKRYLRSQSTHAPRMGTYKTCDRVQDEDKGSKNVETKTSTKDINQRDFVPLPLSYILVSHSINSVEYFPIPIPISRIPLSLRRIIDSSSPPPLDLHRNIPSIYQNFITEMERFSLQQLPADLKQFDCALALNWRRLWPWLKCGLKSNRVFETERSPLSQSILRARACASPVLSVLTRILSFSPERETQASLACKIFESSEFIDLLSLAWVVAIIEPHSQQYVMYMLEETRIEQLVDKDILRAFARQFDACCLKLTGKSFVELWEHRITSVVDKVESSAVDREVDLFLQLLRVPGNQVSVFLDKAGVAMYYSRRLWALLMDLNTRVVPSGVCSSTEIRIRCINLVLRCYLIWLSGGARWVVSALDHNLLSMVPKTCRFLDGVWDGIGCEASTLTVIILREIIQCVHSYKAYNAVSRRVKASLARNAKLINRELSVARLRLRGGHDDVALQEAWGELKDEFYITDACVLRKALWDSARLFHCSYEQCGDTTIDLSSIRPPRVCSRCLTFAYCGVECQRQHYEAIHRRECRGIASTIHEHPIYGQPHSGPTLPSIDLAYIQDMISAAIQIARDEGDLRATVLRVKDDTPARLVVIFDLSKPKLGKYEITSHESALEDEEMFDKERMKLTMDNNVFFCGRVPLYGDSSTLVVCMDRQLSRNNGTIMDREAVVKAYRSIWSREHSKKLLQT